MSTSDIISISFAVASFCIAIYLAIKQYLLQKRSNSVPVIVDIFTTFREPDFNENYRRLIDELPSHDPASGVSRLPVDLRIKVVDVLAFLQQVAALMVLDLVDERVFTALFRARVTAAWKISEPFIVAERQLNTSTGPEYLTLLEAFAVKAGRITPELGQGILKKWLARGI